jgi:Ni/Co efflux regulator RcnB
MLRIARHTISWLFAGALLASPVFADPPTKASKGHSDKKHGEGAQNDRDRGDAEKHGSRQFADRDRDIVRSYYAKEYKRGHCPPGLAKKQNGCMPPGQAKKWRVGHPLPREVVFYDLPPKLVVEIGVPPAGYRYVRVAADILMIAEGTGMVVDAIKDLGTL